MSEGLPLDLPNLADSRLLELIEELEAQLTPLRAEQTRRRRSQAGRRARAARAEKDRRRIDSESAQAKMARASIVRYGRGVVDAVRSVLGEDMSERTIGRRLEQQ